MLLSRFNPRLHLAAAIGWSVAALSLTFALAAGTLVMFSARSALERDIGSLFASESDRIAETIHNGLLARFQWVLATAAVLDTERRDLLPKTGKQAIYNTPSSLPEFEWIQLADRNGVTVAATDARLDGHNVSDQPWFRAGLKAPYLGDLIATEPSAATPSQRSIDRFVEMAAPVTDRNGAITGVLAARLGWKWLQRLEETATVSKDSAIETMIVSNDGHILAGNWPGEQNRLQEKIGGFQQLLDKTPADDRQGYIIQNGFLVGFSRLPPLANSDRLNWWVAIREPASVAFAKALRSSSNIFMIVVACGIAAALLASGLTSLLMKRLERIAERADHLRLGKVQYFMERSGNDEIGRIGQSLAALFESLNATNEELKAMNRELDQRVEDRTREVRRLAEETKVAAVTRERLRMSRDLHDTLAHSMVALLSQIRLIRRIEKAKPEMLSAELAEAERAAQEGLDQARAAVSQLRYMAVRDDGLGPALERLAKRLKERVIVETNVSIGSDVAGMASQAAETIYRIAEEAMHNIEKHAEAAHVSLTVKLLPSVNGSRDRVDMTIEDDGKGFDPNVGGSAHYGLIGIREQAQLIGGDLTIDSAPQKGTRIHFQVPI